MGGVKTLSSIQTGISAEYFVAAELSRRGYVASLTLRNTRGIDVRASNADATKSVGIQVKTCQGLKPDWILKAKAEADSAENFFYVFVCLPDRGAPSFYLVPRDVVAKHVRGLRKADGLTRATARQPGFAPSGKNVGFQRLKRRKVWRRSCFRCCHATNGNAAEKMPSARTKSATTNKNSIVVLPPRSLAGQPTDRSRAGSRVPRPSVDVLALESQFASD